MEHNGPEGDGLAGYEFDVWLVVNQGNVVRHFLSREDAEGYSRGYVPISGLVEIVPAVAGVTDASESRKRQTTR